MFGKDISQKILQNFKKIYLAESMPEILFVGVLFNQILRIDSRPAALRKRSLHQGGFPVNKLEFSALLQKALTGCLQL